MSQASISGFTFIRNGVELGFPFEASIRSLLPLVDEFVVVVGKSNDDTLARIHAIGSPKIRVIETIWNERMADRGFVYAQQKMIAQYACTGDWAFYLEGDEVVHEAELANIPWLTQLQPAERERIREYLGFLYSTPQYAPALAAFIGQGTAAPTLWPELAALTAIGLVFFGLALRRFRSSLTA